jgi:hypothetical protein
MKPRTDKLVVVTCTLDAARAKDCIDSWERHAFYAHPLVIVEGKMGVVPAFAEGIDTALANGAEVIACLHDDLLIETQDWDLYLLERFKAFPEMGLCGFGGGTGLGHQDIYQKGYSPYDLAREGFCSNMRDAESHGRRTKVPTRVACLDGFSQIGRRAFWQGWYAEQKPHAVDGNIMQVMADWGITHHAYDSALGAWAKRLGWEVWMLPVACHHFGGRTAVGDPRYAEWAETIVPGGDRTFWELAHKEVYERFRDVLPIRV